MDEEERQEDRVARTPVAEGPFQSIQLEFVQDDERNQELPEL